MALLLFQLCVVFTIGLLLGPASVWAGGGEGPGPPGALYGEGAQAAVRGASFTLDCPAPDPRVLALARPKHTNMLDIGSPEQTADPDIDTKPKRKPPISVLKEEDYDDSNNDSDDSKGTEETELYPDNGKGIYDDDLIDDFGDFKKPPEEEYVKKKQGGNKQSTNKKLEKKQLEGSGKRSKFQEKGADNDRKRVKSLEKIEEDNTPVTYVWYHNGTEINANESRRFVKPDGRLHFKKFGRRKGQKPGMLDTGEYRCMAVGSHGALLSTSINVSFAYMDQEFSSFPISREVFEGNAVQFPCHIDSNPTAAITWQRNSSRLLDNSRYYFLSSGSLLITDVQKEDEGDYRCIAVNSVLNKTHQSPGVSLAVHKPQLTSYPLSFVSETGSDDTDDNESSVLKVMDLTVMYGENVLLVCAVSGKPKPKVIWNYQSDTLVSEAKEISSMEVYRIRSITEENSGLYTCIANNEHQSILQAYQVTVLSPPYLKLLPKSESTPTAKTVRFNCSAGGNPPSHVVWYKDGKLLNVTGRVKNKPPELIVTDTVSSDRGFYQCIASNNLGESTGLALLEVRAKNVPPPSLVRCRPVSSHVVRISWEAPQLPAVAYTVHFVPADGGEEYSEILTSQMYDLEKLQPYRSYEFYTKTYTNKQGASDQSPHVICHGQGVEISLSSIGNDSVHVKWFDKSRNVKLWQVQWRIIGTNTTIQNVTLPLNVSSYTVRDIYPLNDYEFRVLASPSENWLNQDLSLINWTSSANGTIPPFSNDRDEFDIRVPKHNQESSSASSLRPTHLLAVSTGPSSINVTWRCDAAESSSDSYFFIVCYMQKPGGKNDSSVIDVHLYRERCVESLNSWMEIQGLDPSTLYGFKVQAVMQNRRKMGPFSETVTCRTKHEVKNSVTDVRWKQIDENVIEISWAFDANANQLEEKEPGGQNEQDYRKQPVVYTVHYSQDSLVHLQKWASFDVTNDTKAELRNLSSDVKYYVMVSLAGEQKGPVVMIPPHRKVELPLINSNSDEAASGNGEMSNFNISLILPITLSLLLIAICMICFLRQYLKMNRDRQGQAGSQARSNRVAKSDFECQELMAQPTHVDSKGGVVYINGVESEVALCSDVGEPLLNGHVRITENPRFTTKKHMPNGNCRPLLGKKGRGPILDGTLDVSRYEELPDITVETVLEEDLITDQVCSQALDSTLPMGYRPEVSTANNPCNGNISNSNETTVDIVNGVQLHIDRNSNSNLEIANTKQIKESVNNDKVILDTKSGANIFIENEKCDMIPEKCVLDKVGLNCKFENAKNNCSVDPTVTLDYRENGSSRRLAPALGPNG